MAGEFTWGTFTGAGAGFPVKARTDSLADSLAFPQFCWTFRSKTVMLFSVLSSAG
jgi:hypothetical protein